MENFKATLYSFFLALILVASGCASSGSSSTKSTSPEDASLTLEEHLNRINGVQIVGSGDYAKVVIRGSKGISSVSRGMGTPEDQKDINLSDSNQRQPLFVIDGQKAGRNYPDVREKFTRGEIASVKLLTDAEASKYGGQSGSGVIVITTESAKKKSENQLPQ